MPTPPLPIDMVERAVHAWRAHGRKRKAAALELDISDSKMDRCLKRASELGMLLDEPPAMPGFRISRVNDGPNGKSIEQRPERGAPFEMPTGHVLKGVSAFVDPDGREIAKWIKTKEGQLDPLAIAESLKAAFLDYEPAAPISLAPPSPANELLTLIPLADWHIGMFAWHRETGENWDLKIAERAIGNAVDDVLLRSPSSGECVILGGGDLIHSDSNENKTSRSGNALQVDGRYQKVVLTAARLVVRTIDAALRQHGHVTVRILPGNHDEHASVAVAYFLSAWFRNDRRVTVDTDPSLFWWHRFGKVLLGATHGHTVKIAKMPGIMAHRRAEDWGATKFRYVHGFHLHHTEKRGDEIDGVLCEIHQAPIPQDAWHYGSGFLSGRSVKAITYHRDFGFWGGANQNILDAQEEVA